MQSKQLVKAELKALRYKYGKRFKILQANQFPFVFSLRLLTESETNDLSSIAKANVDLHGIVLTIEVHEDYPLSLGAEGDQGGEAQQHAVRVREVQATERQFLPKGLTREIRDTMNDHLRTMHTEVLSAVCGEENGSAAEDTQEQTQLIVRLLRWVSWNLKDIVLQPEYVESYLGVGIDGQSQRRFTIVQKEEESDDDNGSDDGYGGHQDEEYDDSDDDSDNDDVAESEDENTELNFDSLIHPPPEISATETGILLKLQNVSLRNVSVVECHVLSIQISCARPGCPQRLDMPNLTPESEREAKCPRCAKEMSCTFYPHAVTMASGESTIIASDAADAKGANLASVTSAPFAQIDLNGCSFWDVLPDSSWRLLCFECSHTNTTADIRIRSLNEFACHRCHHTMEFSFSSLDKMTYEQVIEDMMEDAARASEPQRQRKIAADRAVSKRKAREQRVTGITPGQPLPKTGTCRHYKNSYRWLIFPCCNRPYPCDDCHDDKSDHPSIHASKMACGFCSHTQNVTDTCKKCEAYLTRRRPKGESSSKFKTRSRKSERVGPKKK